MTVAALLGWFCVRLCIVPITIGTMLVTVISSLALIGCSRVSPNLHAWAVNVSGGGRFEDFILHEILGLLLFAGKVS